MNGHKELSKTYSEKIENHAVQCILTMKKKNQDTLNLLDTKSKEAENLKARISYFWLNMCKYE